MNPPRPARKLRADYLVSPLGLDTALVLSWEPSGRQTAYRLECDAVRQDGPAPCAAADVSSLSVRRLEIPLRPATRCRWRVRTRTDARWGEWSPPATSETALPHEADWRGAPWIRPVLPGPGPVLAETLTGARPRASA